MNIKGNKYHKEAYTYSQNYYKDFKGLNKFGIRALNNSSGSLVNEFKRK